MECVPERRMPKFKVENIIKSRVFIFQKEIKQAIFGLPALLYSL